MQLHLNQTPDALSIESIVCQQGGFVLRIGGKHYRPPVIVTPTEVTCWPVTDANSLDQQQLKPLCQLPLELLLLGTGQHLVFPPRAATADLIARQIGVEVMPTAAACRTYNLLVADGRKVAAALMA